MEGGPSLGATGTSYVCRLHLAQVAAGPFRLSTGFTTKEEKAKEFLEVSHGPKGWPIRLLGEQEIPLEIQQRFNKTEWAPEFLSGFSVVLFGSAERWFIENKLNIITMWYVRVCFEEKSFKIFDINNVNLLQCFFQS